MNIYIDNQNMLCSEIILYVPQIYGEVLIL